ncbi:MAG: VOC family protein [Planctomycetota bacterium]
MKTTADIYPSLCYDDALVAIDWLQRAFGFEKRLVVPGPNDTVLHSELTFGPNVVIMVGSSKPEQRRVSPRRLGGTTQALSLFVEDADAHCARAKKAGAEILRDVQVEEYGGRGYMCNDPEGHTWYFGSYRPGDWWEKK